MSEIKTYYHTTSNGSQIFVKECGSGSLMLLMHGLGRTTNNFQPLFSHFSAHYTRLRFDFPGSGFSTWWNSQELPSIPQFVENLTSVTEPRHWKEALILGWHSLGSIAAMHYALQHAEARTLVFIGPGRLASHVPAVVERMTSLAATTRKGIQGIRDSTFLNSIVSGSSDLVRTVVRQMISSQNAEGYVATCEAICAKNIMLIQIMLQLSAPLFLLREIRIISHPCRDLKSQRP